MRHGEKVVAVTNFEGKVLVIGEWGSMIEITYDALNDCYRRRSIFGG